MVCAERTDKTHPMAESFAEAKSALDEVFRLYKWHRHTKDFPEEIYLLLSRCTYICFSLWWADQESRGDFFRRSPPPMFFWIGLNFGELRAGEPQGSVSPADTREAHLINDTKWFAFWMKTLELSDPRGASVYREFARHILACVGHRNLLEVKTRYRSRKALDFFLKQNEAGGVLLRTVFVLEDLIQAILRYFSTLDGRTCVLEKIALLTGLLGEMRQIIVWETPANGPYSPSGDARWRARSPWAWLSRDRTRGVLTVIPKREGGEIICIYNPPSHPKDRRVSWVRKVASLKDTYEEALFATWSYETGEHRKNPQQFPGVTAQWTVQYAEAQRLETLSRQIDLLLAALQGNPQCQRMVEVVRGVLRNGSPRWKNTVLPWTYVRQLDQLLAKLISVFRKASTSGGEGIADRVVAQNWAAEETPAGGVDPSPPPDGQDGEVSREAVSQDVTFALSDVKYVLPKANRDTLDKPQQPSGPSEPLPPRPSAPEDRLAVQSPEVRVETAAEKLPEEPESSEQGPEAEMETAAEEPSEEPELSEQSPEVEVETTAEKLPEEPESSGEDFEAEGPAPVHEESTACATSDDMGDQEHPPSVAAVPSAGPTETDAAQAVVPASPEEPASNPARRKRTADTSHPDEIADTLLRRLLEHHGCLGDTINYEPLSAAELQRDLGWNQSKVQRAMTHVFGPKPVNAYRNKCKDRTISTFLKARAAGMPQPVACNTLA